MTRSLLNFLNDKMNFLKVSYVYCVYLLLSYSTEYANGEEEALRKMLQERILCFMVNTAAKIHRVNAENKMYDKNIVFSPMDLYVTTALAHLGAADERERRKLNTVLGLKSLQKFSELNPEFMSANRTEKFGMTWRKKLTDFNNYEDSTNEFDLDEYYNYLVNKELGDMYRCSLKGKRAAIRSSMAIFVDVKYTVKNTYVEDVKKYYDVDVRCTDFKTNANRSTKKINKFVKKRTYSRIPQFFSESIESTTESVLTSSLTLVTNWQKMFQPEDSYETAFHTRDGECDDCDDVDICIMMNQGEIPYYSDSTLTAIALSSTNPEIRMYYAVPHQNQSLSEIISRPNKNFVKKIIDGVKPTPVVYHVPRMTFPDETDLWNILRESGVRNVTLGNIADHLALSIFKQKILLEVNEEGIGGCPLENAKKMPLMHKSIDIQAVKFVADRPFLFFIYDNRTKVFLIYGAVFKPTGYTNF